MLVPETLVTLMTVELVFRLMLPLLMVQLPVLPVIQLDVPPGVKLPLTVAFATTAPLLMSRIVGVA